MAGGGGCQWRVGFERRVEGSEEMGLCVCNGRAARLAKAGYDWQAEGGVSRPTEESGLG